MSLNDYVTCKPTLETERLVLRPLRMSDAQDLRSWTGDASLYRYWGKRAGKSDLNPESMLDQSRKPAKSFLWGIVDKSDDRVIGEMWVYLIENDRMAKVAYRLSPERWGRGMSAEALRGVVDFCFAKTELRRLWADVHVDNHASYRTLEKAGFKRDGRIREGKMVSTYCDYYLYGLLKSDLTDME